MANWPQVSIDTEKDIEKCFGCGRNNPIGLKLKFKRDGNAVKAEFTPTNLYQGWADIVHGGIIYCILDEAANYAAVFEGFNCATAKMEARLKTPAPIDKPLVITAHITKNTRRLLEADASISLKDGTLIAEGAATMFVISKREDEPKTIPKSKTKAVIWDMDGVIADTGPYHFKAWQMIFQERAVNFTRKDFNRQFGQRNDTIIRHTLGEQLLQNEVDAIAHEKEEAFRKLIRQNVQSLPGAISLMKSLADYGFKIALASSAPMENIHLVTESLGINNCFQAIVYGREVTDGKPSPQAFLLAAEKLGVEPEHCIVIEDAIAGVTACKSAGMRCIAVTNTHPGDKLAEADLIVDTLETISPNDLVRLINHT